MRLKCCSNSPAEKQWSWMERLPISSFLVVLWFFFKPVLWTVEYKQRRPLGQVVHNSLAVLAEECPGRTAAELLNTCSFEKDFLAQINKTLILLAAYLSVICFSGISLHLTSLLYGGITLCFRNAVSCCYTGHLDASQGILNDWRVRGELGLFPWSYQACSPQDLAGLSYTDPDCLRASTWSWVWE